MWGGRPPLAEVPKAIKDESRRNYGGQDAGTTIITNLT